MTNTISNLDDTIDVRDIIARVEELREERDNLQLALDGGSQEDVNALAEWETDNAEELAELESLLDDLNGMGGDEQWEGDWYPATLIRDSYFQDYAQELAEECCMIDTNAKWPMTCIDWEQAARELQWDYSSVEVNGVTYWTR